MSLCSGTRLGPYEILAGIGAGGMGEVYKARDSRLNRVVALKVLRSDRMSDPERRRRFVQEAQLASKLQHPNIVTIYEISSHGGVDAIAMELVHGRTLGEVIPHKGLRLAETLKYAVQIADALAVAHAAGITHRDLKPGNIMVTGHGVVKVLDFGLAKLTEVIGEFDETRTQAEVKTQDGAILGSVSYMSPEQAEGKAVDARSDIFSFGAILYEMLTGQRAFQGDSKMSTLAAVLKEDPKPAGQVVEGVPPELDRWVARCLRKDPAHRAQHMTDIKLALDELKKNSESGPLEKVAVPEVKRVPKRGAWWAAGALAVIAGAAVYWLAVRANKPDGAPVPAPSIAVLPLENLSADSEHEYFSDGVTDALITDLAKIRGLRVISRTSVLQFKRTKRPISEIAGQLGVRYVVEGTVMRAGDRVRITAQLIAIPNERHLWAESYERSGSDVLAVQSEIARAIAGQVNIHLTPQEHARLAARPVNPEAHNNYLKGRFEWYTRDDDRLRKSIEYFNRAIEKEPGYALAYAGLADSYAVLSGRSLGPPRRELQARACETAKKAIQLDENLGEGHASLVECEKEWDWQARERRLRRALELSPGYATGHQWLGEILINTGRLDEGLSEVRRSAELDPLSPSARTMLGGSLYSARRYDEAIGQLRQTIEMYPGFVAAYLHLGMAYAVKGMNRESIEILEKAMKLTRGAPPVAALVAHARAVAGDKSEALRLLGEFKKRTDITPVVLALLYLDVGDKDHAIDWLEKGYEQHSLYIEELKVEPLYDSIRGDPRFIGILRKMNLAN